MNGSGVQIASTWPFASAARMAGNGSARSRTDSGSTPRFLSAALIITSPTPLSAFTAMVLPARSAGVRIELEPLTRMFCQLSLIDVPSTSLAANERERDALRARDEHRHEAEVADLALVVRHGEHDVVPALQRPLGDRDPLLLEEALLDPEVEGKRVRDRQRDDGERHVPAAARAGRARRGAAQRDEGDEGCDEGRPRRLARMRPSVIRSFPSSPGSPCHSDAVPMMTPHALGWSSSASAERAVDSTATGSCVALDLAIDVCPQVRELGQLLGRDLVARDGQVDGDDVLHLVGACVSTTTRSER